MHKEVHGKVRATSGVYLTEGNHYRLLPLYQLLEDWMGQELVWDHFIHKFTSREKNEARVKRYALEEFSSHRLCVVVASICSAYHRCAET